MLWELRKKAIRKIPKWYVKLKLSLLRVKLRKNQIYDKSGRLRGKVVDLVIRDYLKSLLFVDTELFVLYEEIKKEKERLIKENQGLIRKVLWQMKVKEEDWEEAYSYALEGLYNAVENWDEEHALSTIAHYWIISKVQEFYQHKSKHFALPYSAPIEEGEEETFEVFLSYSDHFEERVQVQDLLSKLEEEERQVLRHLFWNGYSVGETARLMGFSVKKVRTILQKSLSKLKYYLSPQEGSFRASQMEVSSLV